MTRLLQQGEMVVSLIGSIGCVVLSIILALTEPNKNTSALAIAVTAGCGLLALLLAVSAVEHARHLGRLRWLWLALGLSVVLWYVPASVNIWLYNASAGIIIYAYAGVLGFASVAIGALREVLPRASIRV